MIVKVSEKLFEWKRSECVRRVEFLKFEVVDFIESILVLDEDFDVMVDDFNDEDFVLFWFWCFFCMFLCLSVL